MPCDYRKYPKDWKEIRARILVRDEHCCKFCGVKNYSVRGTARIVLTIAHLDHDVTNNSGENLAALCQRCHNRHDKDYRGRNRWYTRQAQRRQMTLCDEDQT